MQTERSRSRARASRPLRETRAGEAASVSIEQQGIGECEGPTFGRDRLERVARIRWRSARWMAERPQILLAIACGRRRGELRCIARIDHVVAVALHVAPIDRAVAVVVARIGDPVAVEIAR